MNKTFSCFHKDDVDSQKDGLFIRINNQSMEGIWFFREREIRFIIHINGFELACYTFMLHIFADRLF